MGMQLCGLLEEAELGMHPWQPPAAQRPGKRSKTQEQACRAVSDLHPPPSFRGCCLTTKLYLSRLLLV